MVPSFYQADINIGITLQHANYAFFATTCLWIYDFVLTLDKEVAFILDASGPWRLPKLIYLICRYLPFASIIIDMLRISRLGFSLKSCTTLFTFNSYVGGIVLFCAESLFMQRVLAVTGWRRVVACCNTVLFLVPVVVTLAFYNSSSTIMQSPIPEVASCYDSKQGRIVILAYALLVIAEIGEFHGIFICRLNISKKPSVSCYTTRGGFIQNIEKICLLCESWSDTTYFTLLVDFYFPPLSWSQWSLFLHRTETQHQTYSLLYTEYWRHVCIASCTIQLTTLKRLPPGILCPFLLFLHQFRRKCNLMKEVLLLFSLENTKQ